MTDDQIIEVNPLELAKAILSDLQPWDDGEILENMSISYDLSLGDLRLILTAFLKVVREKEELEKENEPITSKYIKAMQKLKGGS